MSQQPRFTTPLVLGSSEQAIQPSRPRSGGGDISEVLGRKAAKVASGLTRLFGAVALATASVGFAACGGSVPETDQSELVIPDVEIARNASAVSRPLENGEGEGASNEATTECGEFITLEESYDPATGDFRYEYECLDDGGAIERSITEGNDDGQGNGHYTNTYVLRDGSEEVWTVEYRLLEDGQSQETTGSNNNGESYVSVRTYLADGSALADETYTYTEATYTVSGTYDAEGRFSGEYIVDLNSTPDVNPDYTIIHNEGADGSLSQVYDGIENGWNTHYDYSVSATGEIEYTFSNDNPETEVNPDNEGGYSYAADLSGTGGYTQTYEDGSLMSVEDIINADGSVIESWVFDDAATAQDIDQEGLMTYSADGSGTGSVTTYVEGGESQTCSIDIEADGTTTTVCD